MVTAKIRGNQGENLVVQLLKAQGWEILATQWYCPCGELDIVACDRHRLIFVEVKTRSLGNWDEDGALAITKSKQKKLYISALEFLGQYPHLSNLDCRFDVALVNIDKSGIYQLYNYIESAFSAEES
ncbi:TIGR00252 family protein [Synechococcus sp. PCC 7502]|uniref:YraN family protein n=1 Tax=Synechococcus sp. PCC 7502 TaxID=1173263 RepID=UPI00029FDD38|nr:YraN family protein [Synechococcus sp. PCC 7502]AFY72294.1 TIGR00252 family protein [Synechococcus sp. PCC 7502]